MKAAFIIICSPYLILIEWSIIRFQSSRIRVSEQPPSSLFMLTILFHANVGSCGVPLIRPDTSDCAGYLRLYGVPLFAQGTLNHVRYFRLYGVPLIVRGTSNHVGYLGLHWSYSIRWHVAICYLSYFSPKQHPPSFFWREVLEAKEIYIKSRSDTWRYDV